MKTPNSPDPLDDMIDGLLASQPLKTSSDFTHRVLAAVEKVDADDANPQSTKPWLRLVLPLAASFIAAITLIQFIPTKPAEEALPQTLTTKELREIFIFEEGLTAINQLYEDDLNEADLLDMLNLLNLET